MARSVLDVGCGTGVSALPAARAVGRTDPSCELIKRHACLILLAQRRSTTALPVATTRHDGAWISGEQVRRCRERVFDFLRVGYGRLGARAVAYGAPWFQEPR